jgi:hypothetical protein
VVYDPIPWSASTAVDASIALLMIGVNLFVFIEFFPRDGSKPRLSRAILVGFVLAASAGLWATVLTAVVTQSFNGWTVALFGVNLMMMSPFIWAISLFLRASTKKVRGRSWTWPALLGASLTFNELLMGATFVAGLDGTAVLFPGGLAGLAVAFAESVSNVWFFWAMLGNMVVLLYWVPLPAPERTVWLGLAATAAVGPWVLADPLVGALGMGGVMLLTFLLILREFSRPAPPSPIYLSTVTKVAAGFAVMVAGEALSLLLAPSPWSGVFFAAAAFGVMVVEVALLIRRLIHPAFRPSVPSTAGPGMASQSPPVSS